MRATALVSLFFISISSLVLAQATPKSPAAKAKTKAVEKVSPQGQNWPLEPETFMGVKIGAPITSVTECPYEYPSYSPTRKRYKSWETKTTCWEPVSGDLYELNNVPNVRGSVHAHVLEGNVESVSLEFDTDEGENILQALIAKYGKPQKSTTNTLSTRMNYKVPQLVTNWTGLVLDLEYSNPSGDIEHGYLLAYSHKYARYLEKQSDDKTKSYRDTF